MEKPKVNDSLTEHSSSDELTDKQDQDNWLVCDFDPCYLSGEKREIGKCPWAIANGEGKKDCGYG
jgi:hypothetical protein